MLNNKNFKKILLVQIILLSLVLTGCWDKMEIDERAFVLALGIDHIEPEEAPPQKEMEDVSKRSNHYRVSYIFPKPTGGLAEASVEQVLLSSVGDNIYLTERQVATRMDNKIFMGHLKTVVVGEAVAKNSQMFREVLDALEKDPNISRKISFAVVEGEAKEALEVEPKLEPLTGLFLADLFRGRNRTPRAPMGDLNDILISLHNNGNAPIPRLIIAEEELKLAGTAIIKDYELVGWLGEIETLLLLIVRDEADMINVNINEEGTSIPFQVTEMNRKFKLVEENEKLKIQIQIDAEGDLVQQIFEPPNDVLDPAYLEGLQIKINERLQGAVTYIVETLQTDFETDILGFDEYIRKFHPKVWTRVEADWDQIFPNIEVEVVVDAKIRRVGLSN